MPAYFSLTFELNKSRNAVGAFCKTLIHCGPVFKSGYWGFEDDSRLFIMNHRRTPVFSFELIVPEGNLWVYTEENRAACSVQGKLERMELLKSVAKKMWAGTDLLAIQTGWGLSDVSPSAGEIAGGTKPQTEPFCIIPSSSFLFEKDAAFAYEYMERNGVFIEDITKWNNG